MRMFQKIARGKQCDANAIGILTIQIGLSVMIIIFAEFYWSRLQSFRRKNFKKRQQEAEEEDSPQSEKTKKLPVRKGPSDETVLFENDFPDLRSVIFSP